MRRAIKNSGKRVVAYELGADDKEIDELLEVGRIRKISDKQYEIFSKEAVNGTGEKANAGDYVKLDSSQHPYPNERDFFLKNHKRIKKNEYEQIPKPVYIWQADEPMCPEVQFLTEKKGLIMGGKKERYFTAPLWGTNLSAAQDAYIVFYEIKKNYEGDITDIDFNFVENEEFERTYRILPN